MGKQKGIIEEEWNQRYLTALKIKRFTESKLFQTALPLLTESEVKELLKLYSFEEIESFLKKKVNKNLNLKNIYELRSLARKLGILNYHKLNKDTLIAQINDRRQNQKTPEPS
jgi:hypothetical protein